MKPGLKQFRQEGCLSYVFYDPVARAAAVIDPHVDAMPEYREFLSENGLKPVVAIDTHLHADHYSATHLLSREYGCTIAMSARTASERVTRRLAAGERIEVGSLVLTAIETPGHTSDSICLAGGGLLFSGDTLFIGSTGRTDFPGADPGRLWDSLHRTLGDLPGSTILLPGHDYDDLIFSTMDVERRKNPHLLIPTREEFAAFKNSESMPNADDEIRRRVAFNIDAAPTSSVTGAGCATACGTASRGAGGVASINVEKYSQKLKAPTPDTAYVDVRDASEYREGHIPGVANIPVSGLALVYSELALKKRLYFSCLSGGRSISAAKTFSYLGHPDAVVVSGGYKAWITSGLEAGH